VERTLPGLPELLLGKALRHEPLAALSRAAAGVRGKCHIVNLPGRPRAVTQNMGARKMEEWNENMYGRVKSCTTPPGVSHFPGQPCFCEAGVRFFIPHSAAHPTTLSA